MAKGIRSYVIPTVVFLLALTLVPCIGTASFVGENGVERASYDLDQFLVLPNRWQPHRLEDEIGVYLISPPVSYEEFTVVTDLQFEVQHGGTGQDRVWLAGVVSDEPGTPSIGVSYVQTITPFWGLVTGQLYLEANSLNLVEYIADAEQQEMPWGSSQQLLLGKLVLEKNRAYVTELSYNQQNGRLALRIREKETGEVVYAGHLLIEPLKGTVQAVVGSMHYQARSNPDQWRFAWDSLTIVPGYEQFGPPIALASPPAIYLWQEQADGSQQQVNRTLFKEDVAFGIGIGRAGGMLPGRFYCHILDEEGNRVSTYSLPELPAVVRLADCVPGDYTAQLVYVDGDYERVIGTRRFRVRGARAAFTLEVRPGEDADLQQAILEAYYAGYKEIVIPPGTYRLKPQDRIHLNFRNLEDVTIVARDVEIICTETTRALNIENCRNLHIIGLTIDYDPLPFTQGWIRDMAPDKSWIEVEIIGGYPKDGLLGDKLEILDPATKILRTETYYGTTVEKVGDGRYRVYKSGSYRYSPSMHWEQVGDIAIIDVGYAPGGSVPHAIYTTNSEGLILEEVTVYASPTFAFNENSSATHYLRNVVDRRPLEEDLVPRDFMRLRSANADAFHAWWPTKGPIIEECRAFFMGDDAVNITGKYHYVASASGDQIRVAPYGDLDIKPGDQLEIVTYDGRKITDVTVIAIEPAGTLTADERTFLANQYMRTAIKEQLSDVYVLTLDRKVPVPRGSMLQALSQLPGDFAVINNHFGYNRSRGILIKGRSGIISGNIVEETWDYAIEIAPEYYWFEGGTSEDLRITGNTIKNARSISIVVSAFGGQSWVMAPSGLHRNITIENNVITGGPLPGIVVTSTQDLVLSNNRIDLTQSRQVFSYVLNRFVFPGSLGPVMLVNTTGIFEQNEVAIDGYPVATDY